MIKRLAIAAVLAVPGASQADSVITAYGGAGVDHDLLEIPGSLFSLDTEKSYLKGVGFAREYGESLGGRLYAEVFVGDHTGLQRLTEVSATGGLMYRPFSGSAPWLELRGGLGLSHAFGRPSYEDGPRNAPERRYRTQLGLVLDVTARPAAWQGWGVGMRVHHRSGAYGLIAPRKVGSNFVGLTVSRRF